MCLFDFGVGLIEMHVALLTERRQGNGFPEFLHTALYHHEPPRAPQSKSSVLLLQRAHHHPPARPDVRRPHPGQIGAFLFTPMCACSLKC